MGFMSKWRDGSQWLYDKYGSKLQPAYNKIDSWKTPEWAKKIFQMVWDDILDEKLKKKLYKLVNEICKDFYKLVNEICKDYDEEFAKELLTKVVQAVRKLINRT